MVTFSKTITRKRSGIVNLDKLKQIFIKSLFSGGFDAGRDSESELNIDADYFYDEAQHLGGEADPNDDVLRFNEGGTADFDGKKEEEDDEGDPPPLAKRSMQL